MIFGTHFQEALVFMPIDFFFTTINIFVELFSAFQRIVFSLISIPKQGVYSCSKLLQFGP